MTRLADQVASLHRKKLLMKTLALLLSPRKNGASAALLNAFLEGARSAGAKAELIYFPGLNVSPCRACDACKDKGRCAVKDDMQPLYDKVAQADIIAQASPVYFDQITAQAKIFLDRLYAFVGRDLEKRLPQGKKGAFFLPYGDTDLEAYRALMKWWKGRFEFYFGIEPAFSMRVPGADALTDERKQELLGKAREAGRKLGADLTADGRHTQ